LTRCYLRAGILGVEHRCAWPRSQGARHGNANQGSTDAQATGNLIDNAIRHNEPGGWIRAETTTHGATAWLAVENSGPILD
jgi:hypothetical protein